MTRTLVLFVHVVGMLTLFAGLSLEWVSLDAVRRATMREEAGRWARLCMALPRISGIAVAAIVASGFYLGFSVGVLGDGWMRASYAALLLMGIVSGPVTRPRMRALRQAANDPSVAAVTALRAGASDSILRASLRFRVACGLAVVYLMIGKPDAGGSLLVLGLALILAIALTVSKRPAPSTLLEGYQ